MAVIGNYWILHRWQECGRDKQDKGSKARAGAVWWRMWRVSLGRRWGNCVGGKLGRMGFSSSQTVLGATEQRGRCMWGTGAYLVCLSVWRGKKITKKTPKTPNTAALWALQVILWGRNSHCSVFGSCTREGGCLACKGVMKKETGELLMCK